MKKSFVSKRQEFQKAPEGVPFSEREKSQGTDGKWDLSEFQKVCGRVAHNRLRRASLKI
jgi:hypothetical protein